MTASPSEDIKNPKRVRFNELVYTYYSNSVMKQNKGKARFFDEDFQTQFDFWRNSPQNTKRKRDIKKKRGLYKERSEYLTPIQLDKNDKKLDKKDKSDVYLDSPDILKNLNDSMHGLIETSPIPKSPPAVPVRNGVSKIPKQHSSQDKDAQLNPIQSTTTYNNNESAQSPKQQRVTSPIYEIPKSPKFATPKQPRQYTWPSPKQGNIKHAPPQVPIRQNGVNLRVIRQNSKLYSNGEAKQNFNTQDEVQFLYSSKSWPKQQSSPSQLHKVSTPPMLRPRYKSMIQSHSRDATQYIPRDSSDVTYEHAGQNEKHKNKLHSYTIDTSKGSYTNYLKDLQFSPRRDNVEFYSNNLLSEQKKVTESKFFFRHHTATTYHHHTTTTQHTITTTTTTTPLHHTTPSPPHHHHQRTTQHHHHHHNHHYHLHLNLEYNFIFL